MKTRTITHLDWLPSLPCNNNMLQLVCLTPDKSVWLHSVHMRRVSGEAEGFLEMQFYYVSRMITNADFFKDFKILPAIAVLSTGDMQEQLRRFMNDTGVTSCSFMKTSTSAQQEALRFSFSLKGRPFTEKCIEVAQKIQVHIGFNTGYWTTRLEMKETSEVYHRGQWIPFARYLLLKNKMIKDSDLFKKTPVAKAA